MIGIVFPPNAADDGGGGGGRCAGKIGLVACFFCEAFDFDLFRRFGTLTAGDSTTAGAASMVDGGAFACASAARAYGIPFPVTFAPRFINRSTNVPRFVPDILRNDDALDAYEERFVIIAYFQ